MQATNIPRNLIYLPPGAGRSYDLGAIRAVFKADESETNEKFSISEWWLDPHSEGPGAHKHESNHDIFYVLEGTASILLGEEWIQAFKGSFVMIPPNILHDFRNNSDSIVGLLNMFIPGGFERHMPAVAEWFIANQPRKAGKP